MSYTCIAIPTTPSWFPPRQQQSVLDYSLDITSAIDPTVDFITAISAAVAPSGSGEAVPSNLLASVTSAGDTLLTLTLTGGVQSRVYTIMFVVTMTDGQIYEFLTYQGIPPGLPGYPVPYPPSPGFGTPITANIGTLINNGGVVNTVATIFPITSMDLPAGAVWSNGGEVDIVPGATPNPLAPAVFFDQITTLGLLALGGGNLPLTDPQTVGALWNNGGVLNVSQG